MASLCKVWVFNEMTPEQMEAAIVEELSSIEGDASKQSTAVEDMEVRDL